MATATLDTSPYWTASTDAPEYAPLERDGTTEVVVVGGGVTGLTAAYLLAKSGRAVTLLDRSRCGSGDTGCTTAHLTMVTDTRLGDLDARFGRTHAQAVWDAGLAAIWQIDEIVRDERMDAGFAWVPGYLHAPRAHTAPEDIDALKRDAELAQNLGFDVAFVDAVPLVGTPGLRVDGQARIHAQKYLTALARAVKKAGGRIHEHSEAAEFEAEPRAVIANGHRLRCEHIVLATHNPLVGVGSTIGAAAFQTKLALYSSYVLAGRVARGAVDDALWWDTADPYFYLRIHPEDDHDVVIAGGEDHKTGQVTDTMACVRRLEQRLLQLVPDVRLTHRWSGQVIETPDGLPYIGADAERQYAATGFAGNGMTFGTLAGMLIADAIAGRRNPWAELFDPARKALGRGLWEYLKENADYPYYLMRDRFAGTRGKSLRSIARGHGAVVDHDGTAVAAYRDPSGAVTLRSAICTHMGCMVTWNRAERSWDCPCHGSRFTPEGEVISGPAESPLPPAP
jgi:glycine/D-amino acid oxidase-like deaminating enzyme/nitrite reductase/ring-hydroxylating ferredoxin subunit